MKKLISIAVLVAAGFTANAQNFISQRLLNAQALYVTNIFATNITSAAGIVAGGTNRLGLTWTNNFGQLETSTNISPAYTNSPLIATNIGATYNLFKNAVIPWNRDNTYMTASATNSGIFIHTIPAASGSAAATNAITIVLAAVPNLQTTTKSSYPLISIEVPGTTQSFSTANAAAVTAATSGKSFYFPINSAAFAGCQGFMVLSVTTVAPAAAASDFWIDDIEYVGQQP